MVSKNPYAFDDEYAAWKRALEDPKGIRIPFEREGDAIQFRLRMHKARALDRDLAREAFDREHPMFGRSIYDELTVRVNWVDGVCYLYIDRIIRGEPESLSDIKPEPETLPAIARRQIS